MAPGGGAAAERWRKGVETGSLGDFLGLGLGDLLFFLVCFFAKRYLFFEDMILLVLLFNMFCIACLKGRLRKFVCFWF